MERILTCIVCPKGCELRVELDENGKIKDVSGYTCKRGLVYAEAECTHPTRTVTSTVRTVDGAILPVKTSSAIPKELIFAAMKEINAARAAADAKIGDVIIADVLGTGADVVATANASDCE